VLFVCTTCYCLSSVTLLIDKQTNKQTRFCIGCPQKHIARLQRAQNALAIEPYGSPAAIPCLAIIFVLPPPQTASLVTYIDWRIRLNCLLSPLKLCTQVARNTSPIYCTSINPLGLCALPIHSTINSSTLQPFLWLTRFPYFYTEIQNLNTLPLEVHQSHSLSTFRNRLKTSCFLILATCHQCALILLETSALYKLCIYLLTYLNEIKTLLLPLARC